MWAIFLILRNVTLAEHSLQLYVFSTLRKKFSSPQDESAACVHADIRCYELHCICNPHELTHTNVIKENQMPNQCVLYAMSIWICTYINTSLCLSETTQMVRSTDPSELATDKTRCQSVVMCKLAWSANMFLVDFTWCMWIRFRLWILCGILVPSVTSIDMIDTTIGHWTFGYNHVKSFFTKYDLKNITLFIADAAVSCTCLHTLMSKKPCAALTHVTFASHRYIYTYVERVCECVKVLYMSFFGGSAANRHASNVSNLVRRVLRTQIRCYSRFDQQIQIIFKLESLHRLLLRRWQLYQFPDDVVYEICMYRHSLTLMMTKPSYLGWFIAAKCSTMLPDTEQVQHHNQQPCDKSS